MKNTTAIFIGLILLISACSKSGEEFTGKWMDTKNNKIVMDIERNGDGFIIRRTAPNAWNGELKTKNIPATLESGLLKINMGFGTINMAVDKSTGNLTDSKREYKKIREQT